jgi:hypothetical protein
MCQSPLLDFRAQYSRIEIFSNFIFIVRIVNLDSKYERVFVRPIRPNGS